MSVERDKTISWKCEGCNGKFIDYCQVTLTGAVAHYTDACDSDLLECPYVDTNPKWIEITNSDSSPEDSTP